MTYPGSFTNAPTVATGQISTSVQENTLVNASNIHESVMGLNPAGAYATIGAALLGKLDLSGGTMTGPFSVGSNRITNLGTPTSSSDAATKAYVDAIAQTLQLKASVRVLASANVNLATGGLLTIDGVTLSNGDRVLCVGQTTASENGIYVAASGAWSRSSDANTSALVTTGMYTFVTSGTTYFNQGWVLVTPGPITLGTTSLTFSQFNAASQGGAASGANVDITSLRALSGVLQAPTQVNDANGNAVLQFASTASAINNVSVQNAATGNGPQLNTTGADSNIDLNLATKGTGLAKVAASMQVTANGSTALLLKGSLTNVGVQPNTVSGLELWLKADAITGVSPGSTLTTWTDSSGVGNNATASTTAPTYNTNRINGLPVVSFDGTDDYMTLGTLITDARTVFWVCREVTSAGAERPFLGAGSPYSDFERAAAPSLAYWNSGVSSSFVLNGVTRLNGGVVATPATTNFVQGSFQIVSIVTTGPVHTNQITQDQTITSRNWYGDIAEIIIYNVALSDTDRGNIEAYLANKYALPLTVSTGPNMLDIRDTGNNPVLVVTAGGGQQVKVGIVSAGSTYTATPSDYVIVVNKVTGSATGINLPTTPVTGQVYFIKDGKGDAATNNITITPASGNIDGSASLVLSANYAVTRLVYNGSQWNTF